MACIAARIHKRFPIQFMARPSPQLAKAQHNDLRVPETMTRSTSMQSRSARREFRNVPLDHPVNLSYARRVLGCVPARAQERRDREPNSVYADRRAKLSAQVECPSFSGPHWTRRIVATYIFEQEENFYYLTGHNEEGAGLIILPAAKSSTNEPASGPREFFTFPPKFTERKMEWCAHVSRRSRYRSPHGFAVVKPFADMRAEIEIWRNLSILRHNLPYEKELGVIHTKRKLLIGCSKPRRRSSCKIFARKSTHAPNQISW